MLAPLEERTRPLTTAARAALAASKGRDALEPWNLSYALSGAPQKDALPAACAAAAHAHGLRNAGALRPASICRQGRLPRLFRTALCACLVIAGGFAADLGHLVVGPPRHSP